MSKSVAEKSFSSETKATKEEILDWKMANKKGTVFLPFCFKDGKTGKFVYKGKYPVSTLSGFLEMLEEDEYQYFWYEIPCDGNKFLVPSCSYTVAKFLRLNIPSVWEELGSPKRAFYNPRCGVYSVFKQDTPEKIDEDESSEEEDTDNGTKIYFPEGMTGSEVIGENGSIVKLFVEAIPGTYYRVKYDKSARKPYVEISAPEDSFELAELLLTTMIQESKITGSVEESLKILENLKEECKTKKSKVKTDADGWMTVLGNGHTEKIQGTEEDLDEGVAQDYGGFGVFADSDDDADDDADSDDDADEDADSDEGADTDADEEETSETTSKSWLNVVKGEISL